MDLAIIVIAVLIGAGAILYAGLAARPPQSRPGPKDHA